MGEEKRCDSLTSCSDDVLKTNQINDNPKNTRTIDSVF